MVWRCVLLLLFSAPGITYLMNMTSFLWGRIIIPWTVAQIAAGALSNPELEFIISAEKSRRDCITIAIGINALVLINLQENVPIIAIMVREILTQTRGTFKFSNHRGNL